MVYVILQYFTEKIPSIARQTNGQPKNSNQHAMRDVPNRYYSSKMNSTNAQSVNVKLRIDSYTTQLPPLTCLTSPTDGQSHAVHASIYSVSIFIETTHLNGMLTSSDTDFVVGFFARSRVIISYFFFLFKKQEEISRCICIQRQTAEVISSLLRPQMIHEM